MQKFSGLKILIRNNQRMTYPLERDYHFLQNEFFLVFYLYIHIYVYLCPCDSSLTKRCLLKRGEELYLILYICNRFFALSLWRI